jgi:hypothetical protein
VRAKNASSFEPTFKLALIGFVSAATIAHRETVQAVLKKAKRRDMRRSILGKMGYMFMERAKGADCLAPIRQLAWERTRPRNAKPRRLV